MLFFNKNSLSFTYMATYRKYNKNVKKECLIFWMKIKIEKQQQQNMVLLVTYALFSLWPLHVTFSGIILQGLTLTASGLDQNSHYAPNSAIDVLAQSSAIVSTYHTMAKL